VVLHDADILLVSKADAVEEIVSVSFTELVRVSEFSAVRGDVIMLLNGFNNVTISFELEGFLGNESMSSLEVDSDVHKISVLNVKVSFGSEGTLVVRDGPGGGSHNSEVVVSLSVKGTHKSVLRTESSASDSLHHFIFNIISYNTFSKRLPTHPDYIIIKKNVKSKRSSQQGSRYFRRQSQRS
jgi:hypothetical protein